MGSREDGLQRMEDRHEFIRDIRDGVIINAVRAMLAGKPTKEEKTQRTSIIALTFGLKSADIVAIYNSRHKEDFGFLANLSERDLAEGVALDLGRAGFSSRARLLGCSEAEIDWMLGRDRQEELVFEKLFIETQRQLQVTEGEFKRVKDDRDSLVIQCVDKGDRVRELEEQVKSLQSTNAKLTVDLTSAQAALASLADVKTQNDKIFKDYKKEQFKATKTQEELEKVTSKRKTDEENYLSELEYMQKENQRIEKEKAELQAVIDMQNEELVNRKTEEESELIDLTEFFTDAEEKVEREHRTRERLTREQEHEAVLYLRKRGCKRVTQKLIEGLEQKTGISLSRNGVKDLLKRYKGVKLSEL